MPTYERQAWRGKGACQGIPPEVFAPVVQMHKLQRTDKEPQRALEICEGCSVRAECLAAAIANGCEGMIMGGLLPREINAIRRERKGSTATVGRVAS